jgi:predicted PurR-regulated permease PerM
MMIFIGVVVWLGNLVLGNSNALLLGIISGLMELIPNLGPAIALVPGVLMALLFGSSHLAVSPVLFALIVLAFYLLVQFFENQVVVPKIMGDAVDLPPLVVLIGVFVGGATVGILGIFLATPVIATGRGREPGPAGCLQDPRGAWAARSSATSARSPAACHPSCP